MSSMPTVPSAESFEVLAPRKYSVNLDSFIDRKNLCTITTVDSVLPNKCMYSRVINFF